MDSEKAAKRVPNLNRVHSKRTRSLQDKLLHERIRNVHDREANIAFRHNLLESQMRVNYVNEFDRLNENYYANPNLPAPTTTLRI